MKFRDIQKSARDLIQSVDKSDGYTDDDMDGNKVTRVYLGSVFSLNPSGKYYLPFACSNVELCPCCKGKGCKFCGQLGSREAYEDEIFNDELDIQANKVGAWVESGEGDPCDYFIVWPADSDDDDSE